MGSYKLVEHTVILGYQPEKTEEAVNLLLSDDPDLVIVLVTEKSIENPMEDQVKFVRGNSLSDPEVIARSAIDTADKVLVMAGNDEQAMAVAISAGTLVNRDYLNQMVVYTNSANISNLIMKAVPFAEVFSSTSVEQMVRATQDPGSTAVLHMLTSHNDGPTQYINHIPKYDLEDWIDRGGKLTFGYVQDKFKKKYNAMVIGLVVAGNRNNIILNPDHDRAVDTNDKVVYIANRRV